MAKQVSSVAECRTRWKRVGNIAGKDADAGVISELRAEVTALRAELAEHKAAQPKPEWMGEMVKAVAQEVLSAAALIPSSSLEPLIAESVRVAVEKGLQQIPLPKDGIGLAGGLIDQAGCLVLTLTDGTTRQVGSVVPTGVDMKEVHRILLDEVAKWPRPKDGRDGLDGHGFDDFTEELEDGGRVQVRRYGSGDRVKEFRHKTAVQIYRGVFEQGRTYEPGDTVTWGGSMFCAKDTTTHVPESDTASGRKAWQLCVQRGREGKRGEKGEIGPRGPKGDQGEPGRGHY